MWGAPVRCRWKKVTRVDGWLMLKLNLLRLLQATQFTEG